MFKRIMKRLEKVAEESEERERKKTFIRNLKYDKQAREHRTTGTGSTGAM